MDRDKKVEIMNTQLDSLYSNRVQVMIIWL